MRKSIVERVLLFEGRTRGSGKVGRKDDELRAAVRDARARLERVYLGEHLVNMVAE